MENIGLTKLVRLLELLNPGVRFELNEYKESPFICIYGTIPGEELKCPDKYYYNRKNGITNKHNTKSGVYECFIYEYDLAHYYPELAKKKGFFAKLLDWIGL